MHGLPRSSGILLHPTSLPGPFGIGDLGPAAYRFVDFLVEAGQRLWQMLPLVPVGLGFSPYASPSTFAGNPLLISPERLVEQGLLQPNDIARPPDFPEDRVDYDWVIVYKQHLLEKAYATFEAHPDRVDETDFWLFCEKQAYWLDDYGLFMALKEAHGGAVWTEWPVELVRRDPAALHRARQELARSFRKHQFWQYLFHRQWMDLRAYCHERGIRLMGDIPIYVAHDSADVWAHPHLFHLDERGHPTVVAGVPPDYFSETGQRWGNPLYRWDVSRETGHHWWTQRFAALLEKVDLIRLDHFRGFAAYWEIPASEPTAVNGRWVPGPGAEFFETIQQKLGPLPIVAENLGVITPDVTELMERFGFPGMAVLQFAFDDDATSTFLPHNYTRNLVAYTGTHDNDTIVGWWRGKNKTTLPPEVVARAKAYARAYLDLDRKREREIHWTCIRVLMASVAELVVFPMQDVLGLGSEARMNTPGTTGPHNWSWRLRADQLRPDVAERLRALTEIYGRLLPTA